MQPITFTNGNRIFTPSVQSQQAPELTDLNGDGEIDILDAALLSSSPGGIPIINVPPPTITPPICPKGYEPSIISSGGIIITGCNPIPNVDGTVDLPDTPVFIQGCESPRVQGYTLDFENPIESAVFGTYYPLKITDCVCPETNVNMIEILSLLISLYRAGRKAADDLVRFLAARRLAQFENKLPSMIDYIAYINKVIFEADELVKAAKKRLKEKKDNLTNFLYNYPKTYDISEPNTKYFYENTLKLLGNAVTQEEKFIKKFEDVIRSAEIKLKEAQELMSYYMEQIRLLKEFLSTLLDSLDELAWATLIVSQLVHVRFVIPKFCGAGTRLNEQCECVPISSGSYSSSYTNNIKTLLGYNVIESF